MLGTFQQSDLRIEVSASTSQISQALLSTVQLRHWLFPQVISGELPAQLYTGLIFTSWLGPIPVEHRIETVSADSVSFLLSRAVDGCHDWRWGEGWIQSRLEGISGIPLHFGNSASLLRLKTYLALEKHWPLH